MPDFPVQGHNLSDQEMDYIQNNFFPMDTSNSNGSDIYIRLIQYIRSI